MMEAQWYFYGTVITALLGFVGTLWSARNARHDIDARRRKLESEITAEVLENAREDLKIRDMRIEALRVEQEALRSELEAAEEAAKIKDKYILHLQGENEAKERKLDEFKRDVRGYINSLILWFEQKGIHDYPKPPRNIMDTGKLQQGQGK